ncbi:PWWP domain-containing protein 4 [Cardamine amara subsp. amara]|uniref:PWWP domain-containing protein 4 n=1 Tax=Cardamine amara subsp. amara TaxID=228776 RepID=A0ABD1AYA5_CARAN
MEMESKEETRVPDYKSFLSEFDDYVAIKKMGSRLSLSYGFEVGDMVWGKVKSHPWWPGQIFDEAFASSSVRRMKKIGYVLVAFFGDSSYGWFDPAELIPFEPHVAEKSQQTNSSDFAKAVEEAMDEVGRRSALGLTCKCRNPCNFRPTNVQGYFSVDVSDYELQAVYSSKQIQKARDSFSPLQTLFFVDQCALAPLECDTDSLKFFQKRAAVCAFREAVFEEFDETYEQAFGARSTYSSVKTQEPLNRSPPRAPLSGSLVIAETLDNPKSSKNAMKVTDSTKQDKYLPKRREEAGDMTVQFGKVQASSPLQGINGSSGRDHVLQRRTPYIQTPMKNEQTGLVNMDFTSSCGDISGNKSSISKLSREDDKGLAQESKVGMGDKAALFPDHEKFEAVTSLKKDESGTHSRSSEGSLQPFVEGKCSAGVGIKKGNVLKRSSGEMNSENGPLEPKKKKKRKKESGSELNSDSPDKRKALSSREAWAKKPSQLDSAKRHSNMLIVRNSELDVLQLLSNLQALSLDPFFGSSDRSFIRAVRQFFLRFRSLVYQKSLATSPSTTKLSKSAKTFCRTNEPSKTDRNRISFDHQQDIPATKKLKKTIQFKPMVSDKKTNQEAKKRSNLAPFKPVRDQGGPVPINAKAAIAQPEKKTAPSAKVVEPTMLVMKFPPRTSLPSTALLKARFGRFGQLDQSAIRVLWKSSICRVVFLYKLDAQTALRYASGSKSLFGNVNVTYYLRDVKAYSAPKTDEASIVPLNQEVEQAPPVHQPNIQLKSCLKNGNGGRGTARVKFMLGGKETEIPFPVKGNYVSSSSSSVAMEFVSKTTQNMVSSALPLSKPKPVSNRADHVEPPLNPSDISQQMMKLLTRCNDVVANVTGLLGYVPYHRL